MKNKKILIFIAILLVFIIGIGLIIVFNTKNNEVESAGTSENAKRPITTLTYEGQEYKIKRDIDTLLIIGTDNYAEDDSQGLFYNYNCADFLVILVFDNDEKTIEAIQLNRDTMCNVQWLDVLGTPQGTTFEQIALSYSYGSGYEDSCENTSDTTSMLCFDAPLDNYIAFTMDAISIVNDGVGGVDVVIPNDMTVDNPEWTEGAQIHLVGKQAEKFARARMELGDENSENRLARQRLYLNGFITAARNAMEKDNSVGLKIYNDCADYIITDYTLDDINQLLTKLDEYTYVGIDSPVGENILGEQFNEFYVDKSSLWEIVRSAFCR